MGSVTKLEKGQVSAMKIEKISKKCPMCKGAKFLPDDAARELPKPPKPGEKVKCPHCRGKGFVFGKSRNN